MPEIRDSEVAGLWLTAGLRLSRVAAPTSASVVSTLSCLLQMSAAGHAVPPAGFVADIDSLALGTHEVPPEHGELPLEPGLVRRYEDYVLGKLYADTSFERAGDALARVAEEDRVRGLAYLVERICSQVDFEGVTINPAVIRGLLRATPEEVLHSAAAVDEENVPPELAASYEALVHAVRNTGDLLLPEDVFELEHGTALAEFGQRLALRQTLRSAELLPEGLPRQRPRRTNRRAHVATRMLDEDVYPVGGFSSISTKGSIESLLHSQLAYLERDSRPDMFDVKFVRDELLYYSRDENQFLRRRTTLVVAFSGDVTAARVKDPSQPYQRIVLALGLLTALERKLRDWLSEEALFVHVIFAPTVELRPTSDEQSLVELILREEIARGAAKVERLRTEQVPKLLAEYARRSAVQYLLISCREEPAANDVAQTLHLSLAAAEPHLQETDTAPFWSAERGLGAWRDVLRELLQRLV